MTGLNAVRERSLALFFIALLAFSPALLVVFSRHAFIFGVPVLYAYLLSVWGGVILCIALNAFPREGVPAQSVRSDNAISDESLSDKGTD